MTTQFKSRAQGSQDGNMKKSIKTAMSELTASAMEVFECLETMKTAAEMVA